MSDFLGHGLLRPFRRDEKNDFANAPGQPLIKANIGQILGTKAASTITQGEIPWRTDAGSLVYLLKHGGNVAIDSAARVYVQDALRKYEPRIEVLGVALSEPKNLQDRNKARISVKWRLIDRDSRQNQVISGPWTTDVDVPL